MAAAAELVGRHEEALQYVELWSADVTRSARLPSAAEAKAAHEHRGTFDGAHTQAAGTAAAGLEMAPEEVVLWGAFGAIGDADLSSGVAATPKVRPVPRCPLSRELRKSQYRIVVLRKHCSDSHGGKNTRSGIEFRALGMMLLGSTRKHAVQEPFMLMLAEQEGHWQQALTLQTHHFEARAQTGASRQDTLHGCATQHADAQASSAGPGSAAGVVGQRSGVAHSLRRLGCGWLATHLADAASSDSAARYNTTRCAAAAQEMATWRHAQVRMHVSISAYFDTTCTCSTLGASRSL